MPSHVHLIFRSRSNEPQKLLQDFKRFTAKRLLSAIRENTQESRKEWILWMMGRLGRKIGQDYQFWQQHNKPIELWNVDVIDQKVDYIHNNSVEAGFVSEPHYWKYSSALDYSGGKGLLELAEL
ncbi:hypothetical protein [Sphingobacterium pedocola]|uniref:Transposase n=1 Tax=Sphingobacterium pedocola TaxID=2082722 RepID=A0ABR9T214_9SPHI|nr:hypothetical protein [Sphingobacterium pedocola]MBE8719368.1 hypothetical protein [Sphingobacterium pedocola]